MLDLSIIIVSFNTEKLTLDCIKSILSSNPKIKYEIILIDNASNDSTVKKISNLKPKNIRIIKNSENLGFAKANNQGMKIAKGRYILLLNSDTKLNDDILTNMTNWMEENKNVGIASCALKNKDNSFQGTGGFFPSLPKIFSWMFFLEDIPFLDSIIKPFHPYHPNSPFYKGENFYKKEHEQDWVTGAFFFVRRKVIDDIGLFDEKYFMYVEEVDFCLRAKKKGWKVFFTPIGAVTHYGGASGTSDFSIIAEFNGIKYFFQKNYPKWQYPILLLMLKLGSLIRSFFKGAVYAKTFKEI
ncbi:MAG: glycosyltransferase family 2 protein [Candidatus Woesebacteria bacterium]|nr:MAG: glycosyltransferase family 2 protein [Candidatus Woesebacteria bacterium]